MQLTKDDVMDTKVVYGYDNGKYLDFSKFQQVIEFYEKYKDDEMLLASRQPEIYKLWYRDNIRKVLYENYERMTHEKAVDCNESYNRLLNGFKNWLFSYCFKEGLK